MLQVIEATCASTGSTYTTLRTILKPTLVLTEHQNKSYLHCRNNRTNEPPESAPSQWHLPTPVDNRVGRPNLLGDCRLAKGLVSTETLRLRWYLAKHNLNCS